MQLSCPLGACHCAADDAKTWQEQSYRVGLSKTRNQRHFFESSRWAFALRSQSWRDIGMLHYGSWFLIRGAIDDDIPLNKKEGWVKINTTVENYWSGDWNKKEKYISISVIKNGLSISPVSASLVGFRYIWFGIGVGYWGSNLKKAWIHILLFEEICIESINYSDKKYINDINNMIYQLG